MSAHLSPDQILIHILIKNDQRKSLSHSKSEEFTLAIRLRSIVVVNSSCWLLVGLYALAAEVDPTLAEKDFNVTLGLIFTPLHAALNPILYMTKLAQEKKQEKQEAKLLAYLKLQRAAAARQRKP
jgi:hypothetical protein